MQTALISDIKHFAVHDGEGIRTTVFFKGCPLKCVWCHNPEGIGFKPQVAFYANKCVGCMECAAVCPAGTHTRENGIHRFDREKCVGCGKCQEVCLGEALKIYGRKVTLEQLLPELLEDRPFYENSGGGVTLSGGECLMQADFCAKLLKALKGQGIHTAVDTCGFVSREALEQVIPYTDIFLYDIKAAQEAAHVRCTGQSNALIWENLRYLQRQGKPVEIRIPYVPGWNDDQLPEIARKLGTFGNLTRIKLLPYHDYAGSKYGALAMENTLPERLPDPEEMEKGRKILARSCNCAIV